MNEDELAAQMPSLPEFVSVAQAAEILGGGPHGISRVMDMVVSGDLVSWSHSVPGRDASIHIDHVTGVKKSLPYVSEHTDPYQVLVPSYDVIWHWCIDFESLAQKGNKLPPKKRVEARFAELRRRAKTLKSGKVAAVLTRSRKDPLTPLIASAQRQCKDPGDAREVFNLLCLWASEVPPKPPLFGRTLSTIQWYDDSEKPQELSVKNLRDRLKRVPVTH